MTELERSCVYEYKVGAAEAWSKLFYTPGETPDNNDGSETVGVQHRLFVFGDWGCDLKSQHTQDFLLTQLAA
jgi:hypothetical protein